MSKEAVTRVMSKARKYQAQLEERKVLQKLLDGLPSDQQEDLTLSSRTIFKELLKVEL